MVAAALAGCAATSAPENAEPLRVVVATFPQYDWVRQILGDQADRVQLTLLLDDGVDLHSYQPTAEDLALLSRCDLFIYTGGESDVWVQDALAGADPGLPALSLLDVLGDAAKSEELLEGMQEEEDPHGEEQQQEPERDEHVWLSLRHAATLCSAIANALGQVDPDHRENYEANAAAYIQKLTALDEQYSAVVEAAPRNTLLFADRFPFRYLADDYGLVCYAAFPGCSAETEASFETVAFLAGKVDELALPSVLVIEGSARDLAETVVRSTRAKDQRILVLDSMQSVTAADVERGVTYLSVMEQNLQTLRAALG